MEHDQKDTARDLLADGNHAARADSSYYWNHTSGAYRVDVAAVIGLGLCALSTVLMGWLIWSHAGEIALGLGLKG